MDAQTLATAAGVPLGTLNMWVTRGFIPGERLGRGRRREFDLEVAIRVGIVAELVRFGVGLAAAVAAAGTAMGRRGEGEKLLVLFGFSLTDDMIVHNPAQLTELQEHMRRVPVVIPFNSEDDLPAFFERQRTIPNVYAVINIKQIEAKMRRANEEWEQQRQGKRG